MPADRPAVDLAVPAAIHVVGVGGAGMSTLALLLAEMGHTVSGSDLRRSSVTDRLERAGVRVSIGHSAAAIGDATVVTGSPAVPADNPELVAAVDRGVRVVRRPEMMAALAAARPTAAVAGTHGKTTTSSMLSLILVSAGLEPSYLLGADVPGVGAGALWGSGEILVLEADESYGAFEQLAPALTVVTNVEADHLDHYGDLAHLEEAFADLLGRTSGRSVVMADDPGAARVGAAVDAISVGTTGRVDALISSVALGRSSSRFAVRLPDGQSVELLVGSPGLHNVRNASVAAVAAAELGAPTAAIAQGLARFAGVPRRFEFRGEAAGITFVDDYAHLSAEVGATLAAAEAGGFARTIAVFQPHRYTRTQNVAGSFVGAFAQAAHVVVTDVYSAGEEAIPGVSGQLVATAASQGREPGTVHYVADRAQVADVVLALLRPGDLCLTLGAGDLTELPDVLMARLG